MSAKDWTRIADAACDVDQIAQKTDVVLTLHVRVDDLDDLAGALAWIREDIVALDMRGAAGVYEIQWCEGAARVTIARLP